MKSLKNLITNNSHLKKVICCMAVSMAGVAQGADINVNTSAYGNTWGEWSARWSQWAYSIPAATNPISDTTGANCALGQSGPVWFLAGTAGGAVTRACTVPGGKSLFFPIVNATFGAGVNDCEPTAVGTPCIMTTLRKAAADSMDSVTLEASIDRKKLKKLDILRVQSSEFTLTLPLDNFLNVTPGTYSPNVGDGYYVMLDPLKSGAHTIHFKATVTDGPFAGFSTEVTYNLTVTP